MKSNRLSLILTLVMLCGVIGLRAQELPLLRPVTSSYSFEFGKAHIADTYLTPLHYRGSHLSALYERDQAMRFDPVGWTMQLKLGIIFDSTENPSKNATMINGEISASWAMMRRWRMPYNLTLGFGGGSTIETGVLYLSHNSNNPASAKASWTLDATGYINWNTRVWRLPMTLRYQATLPIFGAFFSPDYGELYYQIYVGDRNHLVHAAWPGNFFNFDNLITADLHFGNTSLRIGYHNRTFSSKVNNIVSQNITHGIVIGITTEWISLRPNDHRIEAETISAY